jgi:hypothetical protein
MKSGCQMLSETTTNMRKRTLVLRASHLIPSTDHSLRTMTLEANRFHLRIPHLYVILPKATLALS